MISSKHLAIAIFKLAQESVSTTKIMSALYTYLEKHKLLTLLPATLRHLESLQKNARQFESLKIVSSLPIDDKTLAEIKRVVTDKETIDVESAIDSEIIGGFVATHQGFIYDASLKNQLNLLRTKLIEN